MFLFGVFLETEKTLSSGQIYKKKLKKKTKKPKKTTGLVFLNTRVFSNPDEDQNYIPFLRPCSPRCFGSGFSESG
jgi:hypothetical protein